MKLSRALKAALPVGLLAVAAWTLQRELRAFHFHDVQESVSQLPGTALAMAMVATALNYLLLTLYDVLALTYVRRRVPYGPVALTSFISYAFGHNVGLSLLSSGSVRYRLYSAFGLSGVEITQVIAFTGLTLWLGMAAVTGAGLVLSPADTLSAAHVPVVLARVLGATLIAAAAAYVVVSARVKRPITVRQLTVTVPSPSIAAAQVALSTLDWLLAALVLFLLLPTGVVSLPVLLSLFLVAQVAGLLSQVPGGLGVFESVMLAALSSRIPAAQLLGILVVYRLVYYLGPFGVAVVLLVGHELHRRRERLAKLAKGAEATFAPVVPYLAAVGAFVSGTVLLFSGATPTLPGRLAVLKTLLPLGLLELSHFLASIAGIGLLLLARGLQRRLDAAYVLTVALLAAGMLFSLVKGFDYEEAVVLGVMLLLLAPFRPQFYRHTSLVAERFTVAWTVAIALVLGASIWLGYFSYKHVDYSNDLWWRFTFRGDAPRFLRATVGVLTCALAFAAAQLLRPAAPEPTLPSDGELDAARAIVRASPDSNAHLALVRDKALLLNEAKTAFIMYAVEGRSWVSMGDPIGSEEDATELAWAFRALSDRHGGWTCFYQVGPAYLPRYLDLGLALLKLGEEATVPLPQFSLEGPERRSLRQSFRRAEREGLTFEMIPDGAVPGLMPELERISNAWLSEKSTREKGFSVGYFDPDYLREGPVALIRYQGAAVGFANVWTSEAKDELSVDLMRYVESAPKGVMDFLFVSLMEWGREHGYQQFNLGMAPLSGLEERQLAPLWSRLGAFLYRQGEQFYNFQGLRQYKEKFAPEWRPRYLAAPGGVSLPWVLKDIAALVSRGLRGVIAK